MRQIKNLARWLYTATLKSFRGLICEKKDGGWELSTGRCMAWCVFYFLVRSASGADAVSGIEWLFYSWVTAMAYCGYSKVDLSKALGAIRKP